MFWHAWQRTSVIDLFLVFFRLFSFIASFLIFLHYENLFPLSSFTSALFFIFLQYCISNHHLVYNAVFRVTDWANNVKEALQNRFSFFSILLLCITNVKWTVFLQIEHESSVSILYSKWHNSLSLAYLSIVTSLYAICLLFLILFLILNWKRKRIFLWFAKTEKIKFQIRFSKYLGYS